MVRRIFGLVAGFVFVAFFLTAAHASIVGSLVGSGGGGALAPNDSGSFSNSPGPGPLGDAGEGEVVTFTVTGDAGVSTASTQITVSSFLDIDGFDVTLVVDDGGGGFTPVADTLLFSESVDGDGNLVVSFAGLSTGTTYGLRFTGNADGTFGGTYLVAYAVSAVPLPPAAWLFLSSLVGLAGVVRHRRSKKVIGPKQRKLSGHAPEAAIAA